MSKTKKIISDTTQTTIDIEGIIGMPEQWQFDETQKATTYSSVKSIIDSLKNIETEELVVNIRSCGGNVNDAILIYEALRSLNITVITRCYGYVASAATIIAQAASEGMREISSNSLYLIHRSNCSTEGNVNDIKETIDMLSATDERIASLYASRSGMDAETYRDLMSANNGNGKWLSPQEVVQYALADRIIDSEPISNDMIAMVQNLGLPQLPSKKRISSSKMSRKWSAILHNLRISDSITPIPENDIEDSHHPVADDVTKNLPHNYESIIEDLNNQIVVLEIENSRLKAHPTCTIAKEDPSVDGEIELRPNDRAYYEDVLNFR